MSLTPNYFYMGSKKIPWLLIFSFPLIFSTIFIDEKTRSLQSREDWIDSVMLTMDQEEKIGQLFSVAFYPKLDEKHFLEVEEQIKKYHIGNLVVFQGGAVKVAGLINRFQKVAKIPMLVGIDGEWGLGMRLDSALSFPRQMTLGAIQNDSLIYQMGKEVARQCLRMGIHVNFAPVVDINNNPGNPVIGDRSFGEDKENVARKGKAYMLGMQDYGLMASAKHFPGHGDTDQDSHYTLPLIQHNRQRLNEIELFPFKELFKSGLQSVMVGHLKVPALDQVQTILSQQVIKQLLKDEMGFEGLVFTDALGMKGVADFYTSGELEILALQAGNDIMLLPKEIDKAFKGVQTALQTGRLKKEDIDKKVKKVLRAKYTAGLHRYQPAELSHLLKELNKGKAMALAEELFQNAMTVLDNQNNLLPLQVLDTLRMASVCLGCKEKNTFQQGLDHYAPFEHFQLPSNFLPTASNELLRRLGDKNLVIVSLQGMNRKAWENYGISQQSLALLAKIKAKKKMILVVFGLPYALKNLEEFSPVVCTYEENQFTQKLAPQLIFGAFEAKGKLPVSAGKKWKIKAGQNLSALQRLAYVIPESAGLHSDTLQLLDEMIAQAIKDSLMPGCQLLVARKGKVAWNKAYGHFTYDGKKPVNFHTVYDVASVTKVSATLQVIMQLYDKSLIKLDDKVSKYLPDVKNTDKANITLRELLTHQAGLTPYIPYWERTLRKDGTFDPRYYSTFKSETYPNKVTEGLYSAKDMDEVIWKWNLESKMGKKDSLTQNYKMAYSDLSFYFLRRVAEKVSGQKIDLFLQKQLYQSLGMRSTGFQPWNKKLTVDIPPTEDDKLFRKRLVQGSVHDQGAAMLGGLSGHAGLFSNVNELAILLQMQLQKGIYGGKKYLQVATVDTFNTQPFQNNRRALGWDKPDPKDSINYIPDAASPASFGHSGFTGCVVWVDPKLELIIVFLSNRIYPSVDNRKMISSHFRRKMMNVVYKAIIR